MQTPIFGAVRAFLKTVLNIFDENVLLGSQSHDSLYKECNDAYFHIGYVIEINSGVPHNIIFD